MNEKGELSELISLNLNTISLVKNNINILFEISKCLYLCMCLNCTFEPADKLALNSRFVNFGVIYRISTFGSQSS